MEFTIDLGNVCIHTVTLTIELLTSHIFTVTSPYTFIQIKLSVQFQQIKLSNTKMPLIATKSTLGEVYVS